MLLPPYLSYLAPSDLFLVSPDAKSPEKETFYQCARGETNKQNSRSTKRHQNQPFKNCSKQWEKHVDGCIASNGEHFEGD